MAPFKLLLHITGDIGFWRLALRCSSKAVNYLAANFRILMKKERLTCRSQTESCKIKTKEEENQGSCLKLQQVEIDVKTLRKSLDESQTFIESKIDALNLEKNELIMKLSEMTLNALGGLTQAMSEAQKEQEAMKTTQNAQKVHLLTLEHFHPIIEDRLQRLEFLVDEDWVG